MTRTIISLILALAPVAAAACPAHETQAMSCAEGSVFDAATNSCKVVTG